jgi:hypothetical protein
VELVFATTGCANMLSGRASLDRDYIIGFGSGFWTAIAYFELGSSTIAKQQPIRHRQKDQHLNWARLDRYGT